MTFATKVKSEISHNKGLISRDKKAFSYGMLLCGKSFSPESISMTTENKYIAKLYAKLIFQQIPMQTSVTTREYNGNFQQSTYAVSVDDGEDRRTILGFFEQEEELLTDEEHRRAFVAGALLSAGNISDPQKDYHLEFALNDQQTARRLLELAGNFGQEGRKIGQSHNIGPQQLRAVIQIADNGSGAPHARGAYVAYQTLGHAVADQGEQRVDDDRLNLRLRKIGHDFISHRRRQIAFEVLHRGIGGRFAGGGVELLEDGKQTMLEGRKGVHAQVIDGRLQHLHLFAAGLGGLRVLDQQIAIGFHIVLGHLPGNVHLAGTFKIGACKQRQQQERTDENPQAFPGIVARMNGAPQHAGARGARRLFLMRHRRSRWRRQGDDVRRPSC